MKRFRQLAPGLAIAGVTCEAGFAIAHHAGMSLLSYQGVAVTAATASPISGIPVAILLGLAGGSVLRRGGERAITRATTSANNPLEVDCAPGFTFASKTLLQTGICCVGTKLSLVDLATTGVVGVPAVAASVFCGMTLIPLLGRRAGLTPKMSSLIACGTSICGVTAISAVAPSIKASEREMSFAIANVVAFGTAGMLLMPYVAHAYLATSSHCVGIFLGLSVHDTSQVIGAALTYSSVYGDEVALKAAAVTKLTRNLCLAGVVPYMTLKFSGNTASEDNDTTNMKTEAKQKLSFFASLKKHTPTFVVIFLCASAARTVGDVLVGTNQHYKESWKRLIDFIGNQLGSHLLLGTAMAAVGFSTKLSALRGVGMAPFAVGAAGSMIVGGTGFASALLIQRMNLV